MEMTVSPTENWTDVEFTEFFGEVPLNITSGEVPLNITYMVCELLVAMFAVVGNALVILVFHRERRLRRRTNYYIVSLAIADLLVGMLGIPFAILASIGLPKNLYACLFTVSLLVVLCTISIFCLVAVSVDRYWAILHPMGYSRNVSTKTAIGIIGICWLSGTLVGFLPLLGWHKKPPSDEELYCYFTKVMDYNYLVFLYFATIIAPAILLALFYAHIYRVVLQQLKQIVMMNPAGGGVSHPPSGGGTMLRMLGAARKREVKATQNLSIIVLFFIICWIPLYTINCIQAFCHDCFIPLEFTNFCIILSHLNSAINPLLYAYHLRDFRAALKNLLCCLFGLRQDATGNDLQGGRYGSHNTLHHHGINTPTRNNSIQSLQQQRINQSQHFTESTILSTPKNSIINSSINSIISSMGSIATLPLENLDNSEPKRKRMWTLTEVSSTCEDDVTNAISNGQVGGGGGVELRGDGCGRKNKTEWTTGQVNSAYIGEGINLDYDDDDDDVFIPEITATPNVAELNVQNRTCLKLNGSGLAVPDSGDFVDVSDIRLELKERKSTSISNSDINDDRVVVENSFNNHANSPLISEIERNNRTIDDSERTELAKCDSSKKPLIIACDRRNNESVLEKTGDYYSDGIYKSNASPKNQKLSPLKIVGEFLFQTTNKKSNRFKEETSIDSCQESDSTLEAMIENAESIQDRIKSYENVQNSDCDCKSSTRPNTLSKSLNCLPSTSSHDES